MPKDVTKLKLVSSNPSPMRTPEFPENYEPHIYDAEFSSEVHEWAEEQARKEALRSGKPKVRPEFEEQLRALLEPNPYPTITR